MYLYYVLQMTENLFSFFLDILNRSHYHQFFCYYDFIQGQQIFLNIPHGKQQLNAYTYIFALIET